jgi:hypothetical protein
MERLASSRWGRGVVVGSPADFRLGRRVEAAADLILLT